MASAQIPEAVRRVFTEAFAARDIAEPLASFDADTPAAQVRAFMEERDYDAVGVRAGGQVVGYVERGDLDAGTCGERRRGCADAAVVEDMAPLLGLVMQLNQAPAAFVTVLGQVGGIVTRADLQKPPVRMWLFGILTLIELRCAELIERHCPGDTWKAFLSEARLEKARVLLEERARRNQALRLVDCLQFGDKRQIIARNEDLRKRTIFPSRRQAEAAIKRLEQLRNNLAHAQDIITADWDTIVRLCEFIGPGEVTK